MDRLYLLSWYYQGRDGESQARDFFGKLRQGMEAGLAFPFACPHQIGLVFSEVDPHWCVGVLVMRGTPGDDSLEQTNTLLAWFEKCGAAYAGTDRTGIRAAGTTIESTLHTRYGSHYKIMDTFDAGSLPPAAPQPAAPPDIVQHDPGTGLPSASPAPQVENYRVLFSDQEWKTLQFSIYWIFRQVFLIHHIGKVNQITESQTQAMGKVLSTIPLIKSDLARQVLTGLTGSREIFTQLWDECFADPRLPADGLIDVARLVDARVPAEPSLEFKRTFFTLARFIHQEHEKLAGKSTSGSFGSLSEGQQGLIIIGSSLQVPENEILDDIFGPPVNIYFGLETALGAQAAEASVGGVPVPPAVGAEMHTQPAGPETGNSLQAGQDNAGIPLEGPPAIMPAPPAETGKAAGSFVEKDNLGTRYDTTSRGTAYWRSRTLQGPDHPFVIDYFDRENDAREALLELPCIHLAVDTQQLICTEVLDFGCYQKESGEFVAFIAGADLTHGLWEQAKEVFARHGGVHVNELEPEKHAPVPEAAEARPDQVVFVREETRMDSKGRNIVHRIYRGPDAASAQAFLKENPVNKRYHYLVVETPQGKYCRDIQGFYKLDGDALAEDHAGKTGEQVQHRVHSRTPAAPEAGKKAKRSPLLFIALGIVALFVLCLVVVLTGRLLLKPGISSTPRVETTVPGVAAGSLPRPGLWKATAEFGEFTFVVNSRGTGIIEYDFGGINVKTDDDEGYPITDSEFGSYLSFIKITGKFEDSASASGTWEYIGKSGSGSWTAIWMGARPASEPTRSPRITEPPEATPATAYLPVPTQPTDAPLIQSVVLRSGRSSDGQIIYQDVYFTDRNGDVVRWDFKVVSSTLQGVYAEGSELDIPSAEQKSGAMATGEWGCGSDSYSVTLSVTLIDKAGNRSLPYEYTMECGSGN